MDGHVAGPLDEHDIAPRPPTSSLERLRACCGKFPHDIPQKDHGVQFWETKAGAGEYAHVAYPCSCLRFTNLLPNVLKEMG